MAGKRVEVKTFKHKPGNNAKGTKTNPNNMRFKKSINQHATRTKKSISKKPSK